MCFHNKYLIFVLLLIILCVFHCIQCKEKDKKRSDSTLKSVKKKSTSAEKLVISSTKSVLSTTTLKTTAKPIKSIRSQKKIKKSLLGSKEKISKNNVFKSGKQTITASKPTVNFANGLSGQQRDKAIEIVTEVLENTNKTSDLVECIRSELERELGLRSNVILSSTPFMEQSLNKIPGTVVMQLSTVLTNGKKRNDVLVSVFGLMKGNDFIERSNDLMKTAQKLSPKIIDSLMSTDMKQEITKMSTRVVRNAKNMEELSDQLSEVLNDRFGPHWHSVVGHKNMMSVDNHRKTSVFFLNMDFGDMRVAVFK